MQNKLQELTEKLYQEGLVKGKAEGEEILAGARKEAAAIIEKAQAEAASIIAKAEKDASDLKAKVDSDLKMASAQCLQATKKDIENLLVGKIEAGKVSETLKDSAFVKEIIKAVLLYVAITKFKLRPILAIAISAVLGILLHLGGV